MHSTRPTVVTAALQHAALREGAQGRGWRGIEQGRAAETWWWLSGALGLLSCPSRPGPLTCVSPTPPFAGGFATFSSCFPGLCEGKPAALLPMSLSQPCLPVPSVGLTRILPHLYLGSQKDVLNKVCAQLGSAGGGGGRSSEQLLVCSQGRRQLKAHQPEEHTCGRSLGWGHRRTQGGPARTEQGLGRARQGWVEKQLPASPVVEPTCQTADVTGPLASAKRIPCFKNGDEGRGYRPRPGSLRWNSWEPPARCGRASPRCQHPASPVLEALRLAQMLRLQDAGPHLESIPGFKILRSCTPFQPVLPSLQDLMTQNGISYVLNASNSCPKPDFICESRFLRIPVSDSYCERLLPWLDKSIEFIGEAPSCPVPGGAGSSQEDGLEEAGGSCPCRCSALTSSWDCWQWGRQGPDLVWERLCCPSPHLVPTGPLPPDKAKLSSCQVIVHCLAGISRSATIAIAYIMKTMGMSSDDAYR